MRPLRAASLEAHSWIEHGFGTRHDDAWTPLEETATLHQVHGAHVVGVSSPGHHGDGDALITRTTGLWLEIRTADCLPILVADVEQRIVAAIHAGWRGTVAGIVSETVRSLVTEWGSDTRQLIAVIGPCIGVCCFTVGPEVAAHFEGYVEANGGNGPRVDLAKANGTQLTEAGLRPQNISTIHRCTMCLPDEFYSFRRDASAGRMRSAVLIKPDANG